MDWLEITNYKYKILNEISGILKITSGEALSIFNFIEQYPNTGIAEVFRLDCAEDNNKFISDNGLYYINIKLTALVIIANLLDIHLTHGALGLIMTLTGANAKGIYRLSPEHGETCILQEIIISSKELINKYLLSKNKMECINNHLACSYQKEGTCCCTPDDAEKILDILCGKNLLEKLDDDYYRIRDTWMI